MQFILGTANLTAHYGITNATTMSRLEAIALLGRASALGIRELDTAPGYGSAEAFLGEVHAGERFAVTTKCSGASDRSISSQVGDSLRRLGVIFLETVLVHDWSTLDPTKAALVAAQLRALLDKGVVGEVGVSVYEDWELERAARLFGTDLGAVQVPLNALDQRLLGNPVIETLASRGVRVLARSVFLQGLLASSELRERSHPALTAFHAACSDTGLSGIQVALAFLSTVPWLEGAVVGANSANQLAEVITASRCGSVNVKWEAFACADLGLTDPRRWGERARSESP